MDNTKLKVLFIGGKNIPIDVHTHILEIENIIVKYLDFTSTLSGGGAFWLIFKQAS